MHSTHRVTKIIATSVFIIFIYSKNGMMRDAKFRFFSLLWYFLDCTSAISAFHLYCICTVSLSSLIYIVYKPSPHVKFAKRTRYDKACF